jgi:uncharacterized protein (DUF1697 family)
VRKKIDEGWKVRCIALLRVINVSGRKTVNMTDSRRTFESLSFENVRTYAQSGNVIFNCERAETAKLAARVKAKRLRCTPSFFVLVLLLRNPDVREAKP